jgi:ribosomal protein L37AE/L43A
VCADEVYFCDRCHDAAGVKGIDGFWLCLRCAAEYIAQISSERWKR